MRTQIVLAVVVALLAGVVGAFLMDLESAPTREENGDARCERFDARLVDLERRHDDLLARLVAVENREIPDLPVRAEADEKEANDTTKLAQFLEALANPEGELTASFRREIAEVMTEIREAEDREREQELKKLRRQVFEARLQHYAETLRLTPYQAEQMREALAEMEKQLDAAREKKREDGDWLKMRETMSAVREAAERNLATFLTVEQLESYRGSSEGM